LGYALFVLAKIENTTQTPKPTYSDWLAFWVTGCCDWWLYCRCALPFTSTGRKISRDSIESSCQRVYYENFFSLSFHNRFVSTDDLIKEDFLDSLF